MVLNKISVIVFYTALLLIQNAANANNPPPPIKGKTNIDVIRSKYLTLENALWQVIPSGMEQNFVLQQIHDTHITFLQEDFGETGLPLSIFDKFQSELFDKITDVNLTIKSINDKYLHENIGEFSELEAMNFARTGVPFDTHIQRIFQIINNRDFFENILNKAAVNQCGDTVKIVKSANQLMFDCYTDISSAMLKAYTIVQLSYMFLTAYGRGDHYYKAQLLRNEFIEQTKSFQELIKSFIRISSKDVWACDPNSYKNNYEEVTRLLQGYIENEVNLNSENDCKKTCKDYQIGENLQCFSGTLCSTQNQTQNSDLLMCRGKIHNCDFVGSDMNICPSSGFQFHSTNRRYEYIKYDNGRTLGIDSNCPVQMTRVESWRRWLVQCSQCFCYCDEQGPLSDRYFSLQSVVSDIEQNKIVTGIGFRKYNRIIHLKISERTLNGNGKMNGTYPPWASWKHGNYFSLSDIDITEGVDYHTLTFEKRAIDLDTIIAPDGHVITGVRLQLDKITGHLYLEIRITEFDFETGRLLNLANTIWISADRHKIRSPITLTHPDVPINSKIKSVPDRNADKYIEFQPTDMDADAGQSTVPFIDILNVEPEVPIPLIGAGIYYKGQPHFGGFIAPKLIVYDFSQHITAP